MILLEDPAVVREGAAVAASKNVMNRKAKKLADCQQLEVAGNDSGARKTSHRGHARRR